MPTKGGSASAAHALGPRIRDLCYDVCVNKL